MPTAGRDGRETYFHVGECVEWLEKRSAAQTTTEVGDLTGERARLAKEQADKYALENEVRRKNLIPSELVAAGWDKLVMNFRSRMLAMPSAAATEVAAAKTVQEVESILSRYVDDALTELADSPLYDADGGDGTDEESGPSSSEADDQ